jgi:hypothetical protein
MLEKSNTHGLAVTLLPDRRMSRLGLALVTAFMLSAWNPHDAGATVMFSGSGQGLSATAYFTISGAWGSRQLTILLTNTDTATGDGAPSASSQVPSGLFFNLGFSAFDPVAATLKDGSTTIGTKQADECDPNTCDGTTNVGGGEFSYAYGAASWLSGTTQGVSSSAYLSGNTNAGSFNGPNVDDPEALNGINFSLVPTGWSGNRGLDADALVAETVKFVLDIPDGLTEEIISNVYFTYGPDKTSRAFPAPRPRP